MYIDPKKLRISSQSPILGPKRLHAKRFDLETELKGVLTKFLKRTEYEVPEYGRLFKPIDEEFTNPNIASLAHRIKFSIKASTEKENQTKRILKMQIFSQKGNSITPIFECGTKEELMKLLKDDDFAEKAKQTILQANHLLLKKNME